MIISRLSDFSPVRCVICQEKTIEKYHNNFKCDYAPNDHIYQVFSDGSVYLKIFDLTFAFSSVKIDLYSQIKYLGQLDFNFSLDFSDLGKLNNQLQTIINFQ